jgi:phosphoglycerate kinase
MTQTIDHLDLRGKRVLVRIDADVPLAGGEVADDRRLAAALPTLRKVLREGGKPIVLAHLGEPGGHRVDALSLAPVARRLEALLGDARVALAPDTAGVAAAEAAIALRAATDPQVLVLENVRFHPGEVEGDLELAREWASFGEIFVNDAFDASRRAHASVAGVPHILRSAPGYLLAKESEVLASLAGASAPRPLVALVGGADLAEKLPALEALVPRVDALLLAGATALPFLAAKGIALGKAAVLPEHVEAARRVLADAEARKLALVLPVDHFVAPSLDDEKAAKVVAEVPADMLPLDIGPKTATLFRQRIEKAKAFVWCGPVGSVERRAFSGGTRMMAMTIGELAPKRQIIALACGGATAAAVAAAGVEKLISHVSLSGGAFLEGLAGRDLPGLAALRETPESAAAGLDSFAGPVPASLLAAVKPAADASGDGPRPPADGGGAAGA